ncbi:uncharacterized protein LOC114758343 [Neltuma alba]|uniref:uncharacterized protein LOC114758343 n=1 Tax=Neltuma alba TaxID=207710 RepID=UPI0010A46E7B|nr:uncharacterized protein LOC114758343 [Prosopis alba]
MGDSSTSSVSGGRRRVAFLRGRSQDTENDRQARNCRCGMVAPLRTSWTEMNPGRRFYGCPNYLQGGGYGYFHWHDEEMGERAMEVINELIGHVERLYEENRRQRNRDDETKAIVREMKRNERRLKVVMGALVATWGSESQRLHVAPYTQQLCPH